MEEFFGGAGGDGLADVEEEEGGGGGERDEVGKDGGFSAGGGEGVDLEAGIGDLPA